MKSPLKHAAAVSQDTSRLTGEFTKQMRGVQMMKEPEKSTGTVLFTAVSQSSVPLASFSRWLASMLKRHVGDRWLCMEVSLNKHDRKQLLRCNK